MNGLSELKKPLLRSILNITSINILKIFKEIGIGGFGKAYRAKWKNSYQYFALKSLHNIEEGAIKELVREVTIKYIL
jgi:hypothetical protein